MFGIGKKDRNGKQVRIEHRGKYTRASRTGGASVRAQGKVGGVNLTANSKHGVRVSKKVAPGTRIALQRGRFQLLGRWSKGPLSLNLSKSGFSVSAKNKRGTYNFTNYRRSSFKFAGTQVRGKAAAEFHVWYMIFRLLFFALKIAVWIIIFPILLMVNLLAWIFNRSKRAEVIEEK
ncbi:MAG: hypothetical protein R8G60_13110 [Roseovarius pacificus]|nr:hypothetical protein [Roseovarius pacificus]